ncbi:glycoside hydrolase family 104 protein [Pseudooceanicola aestuarii]|uniref:glycoside hydrolase family 104 protein n=1 Tax=Pseudooceanicola aestuarii TaxID=2697319 RepID=UPI0013D2DB34|nr:glycoside hydrolase family 104 protein [Pseudooceanicola aestuarii]
MPFNRTALLLSLVGILVAPLARAEEFSILNSAAFGGGDVSFSLLPDSATSKIKLHVPERAGDPRRAIDDLPLASGPTAGLRHLIGITEARRDGYDAVQHGATRLPHLAPTQLTIGEIYAWIEETPGQPHAIGRYQFIPATLRRLVDEAGLDRATMFTRVVQDRLADILLEDAGYSAFLAGRITRHSFMENLARIWAGLPTVTGLSHYHGVAGNRALISWAEFDSKMLRIFPAHQG